jgi:hypothetical protein
MVRLQPPQLASLDAWIAGHEGDVTRPEAIRRLLDLAFARPSDRKPVNKKKAQKASELASRAAEHIVDRSMPAEEQARRKRALIRGPKEFRDIREDLPKPKKG